LTLTRDEDQLVWFSQDEIRAISWAHMAGEARLEAMIAVWRLQHPTTTDHRDAAAEAWARSELGDVEPVVIVVDVPFDIVGPQLPRGRLGDSTWSVEGFQALAGWRPFGQIGLPSPVSAEWIVGVREAERLFEIRDVAALLGCTAAQVEASIRNGTIPQLDNPDNGRPRWKRSTLLPYFTERGVVI
jgi:hypothetical protein